MGWATDAIVYDEQPVGFKQSWKQRTRWTVGHIQCMTEYTKPLAEAVKTHKTMMNFGRITIYIRKYSNVRFNINIIGIKLCYICSKWDEFCRFNYKLLKDI